MTDPEKVLAEAVEEARVCMEMGCGHDRPPECQRAIDRAVRIARLAGAYRQHILEDRCERVLADGGPVFCAERDRLLAELAKESEPTK